MGISELICLHMPYYGISGGKKAHGLHFAQSAHGRIQALELMGGQAAGAQRSSSSLYNMLHMCRRTQTHELSTHTKAGQPPRHVPRQSTIPPHAMHAHPAALLNPAHSENRAVSAHCTPGPFHGMGDTRRQGLLHTAHINAVLAPPAHTNSPSPLPPPPEHTHAHTCKHSCVCARVPAPWAAPWAA